MAMIDVIRTDEMSRLGRLRPGRLRGHRPRPVAQPLEDLLRHHLQQPGRRRGLPRPQALIAGPAGRLQSPRKARITLVNASGCSLCTQ